MKSTFKLFGLLILSSFLFQNCDPDPDPEEPVELITNLSYTLTPAAGGADIVLTFSDSDGDGGLAPVIQGGTLAINATYNGSIQLLNESADPVEDITEEIKEEDDEHQFFFASASGRLSVTYDDMDGAGNPIGLQTTLTTNDTGTDELTITLRHQPDKSASGVSGGDISNAGGETDIEVTFPIDVQ